MNYKERLEREKAVHAFTQVKLEAAIADVARLTLERDEERAAHGRTQAAWMHKWRHGR